MAHCFRVLWNLIENGSDDVKFEVFAWSPAILNKKFGV